eukprot:1798123-Rhodomonas_salina.1
MSRFLEATTHPLCRHSLAQVPEHSTVARWYKLAPCQSVGRVCAFGLDGLFAAFGCRHRDLRCNCNPHIPSKATLCTELIDLGASRSVSALALIEGAMMPDRTTGVSCLIRSDLLCGNAQLMGCR